MNNQELKNQAALVSGALIGGNLLSEFKRLLILDPVLSAIFGNGKKIFINEKPNLNVNLLPAFEIWWGSERQASPSGYLTGTLDARILFPQQLSKELEIQRVLVRSILRYMDADPFYEIFSTVHGLEEIGVGVNVTYNRIIKMNSFEAPAVIIQIPYRFDVAKFKHATPEIDHDNFLDAEEFLDFLTTKISLSDDKSGESIHEFSEVINE